MAERRSYSVYLRPSEIEAVERLKKRFLRDSTTDLIRFLIKAADTDFFAQNLSDSPSMQHAARGRRGAAANQ